jgi:hypothetical protein
MGALVGAGYGVIEAQWLMNAIFAAGFSLGMVSTYGLIVLAGFWERFFTIAFHTASGAVGNRRAKMVAFLPYRHRVAHSPELFGYPLPSRRSLQFAGRTGNRGYGGFSICLRFSASVAEYA